MRPYAIYESNLSSSSSSSSVNWNHHFFVSFLSYHAVGPIVGLELKLPEELVSRFLGSIVAEVHDKFLHFLAADWPVRDDPKGLQHFARCGLSLIVFR